MVDKETHKPLPEDFLREEFLLRRERNPHYSMRAYARDVGISQAYLSLLLAGKRTFVPKKAIEMAASLEFNAAKTALFMKAVLENRDTGMTVSPRLVAKVLGRKKAVDLSKSPKLVSANIELDQFSMISRWYHIAILDLTETVDFQSDERWISKRLGISKLDVRSALQRLERLGLIEKNPDGRWVKTQVRFVVPTKRSHSAIRTFHRQMILKALRALSGSDQRKFDRREISGVTLAIDPKHLPEAKRRIEKFQDEMAAFLGKGERKDLFQLNVQLFPLTTGGARDERAGQ